jgi:pullulanase/glycogen debranching enzyme
MLTFKDVKYDTWEESMEAIRLIMELGINCVKLLPVFEFDEQENRRTWEGRREQEGKLVLGPRSLAVLVSAKAK